MKKLNHKKWKRIYSCILAVCLITSLVLANQSFGVFAEKTEEEVSTEQGEQTEEAKSTEENSMEESTNTENTTTEKSTEHTTGQTSKTTKIDTLSINEETAVQADTLSDLIDADEKLLKWKSNGGTAEITLNGQKYSVTNDSSYKIAYAAVCTALESQAIEIQDSIKGQTVSADTVWNIPEGKTINLDGNINVSSTGRLIILGNGTIKKSDNYGIINNGTLCLQENVYLDGNTKANSLVQIQSGKVYLADNFHIGNNGTYGVNATGSAQFYMVGGLIGTKTIAFDWYSEENQKIDTKNYDATFDYITRNIDSAPYNYIKNITASGGNNNSGLYLRSNASFYMSDGCIAGNNAVTQGASGGAINAGDSSSITITGGTIFGNQTNGSGGAISTGGKSKMNFSDGMVIGNYSATYAGGINAGADLNLTKNAIVAYNGSRYNGGGILVSQSCTCTMSGNVAIAHNRAIGAEPNVNGGNSGKGGAFRVVGTLNIEGGKINYNYGNGQYGADSWIQDIGGAISAQTDRLTDATGTIRIATVNLKGGEIGYNKANGRGGAIWMLCAAANYEATFSLTGTNIHDNTSKGCGGAVYLEARSGKLKADLLSGRLSNNKSEDNGGGIYMALTSTGTALTVNIGDKNASNTLLDISKNETQKTGGGLYIERDATNANGIIDVNLYSGTLKNNKALNGGAIGVVKGNLNVNGGEFDSNKASKNGGGSYVEDGQVNITKGTFKSNYAVNGGGTYLSSGNLNIFDGTIASNEADYGAGAYVADGKIRMFGGDIKGNTANNDGGGLYVSSDSTPADVVIRSGSLIENKAGSKNVEGNGGAIAVISSNDSENTDHVIIGLRHKHKNLDVSTRTFDPFPYQDDMDENNSHNHESCPEMTGNESYGNGGGIYMNSSKSILDIYCLLEDKNTAAKDKNGGSIMSEGGNVNIGDIGDNGKGNNTKDAVGNIFIKSPMLVKGGQVKLYGNTDNPQFADKILVDIIKQDAGSFDDYRYTQITGDINYKVKYFENFNGTGMFTSIQYAKDIAIKAMGNMYEHEGYKIVGWNTKSDGSGKMYKINNLISENDHEAWNDKGDTDALELYAIWNKIGYTVEYYANANDCTGKMNNQTFEYNTPQPLTPNAYTVKGKHFVEWNTEADGTGTSYSKDYNASQMSKTDGATVKLYARWKDCTHLNGDSQGNVTYKAASNTITETCDCGGHTDSVSINGASVYYDGTAHPATLKFTNNWQADKDITIKYTYKEEASGQYSDMQGSEPKAVGYYKASITVKGATASVEYEIKSPAAAAKIDAEVSAGQHFEDFDAASTCDITKDDAFTVQYTVQNLNKASNDDSDTQSQKAYTTAPVLTFDQTLPTGTTIIMQTGKNYWYADNISGQSIALTSFKKMGSANETFIYQVNDSQKYRFIVDFSDAKNGELDSLKIGLKYPYKNPTSGTLEPAQDKEETATISLNKEYAFTATTSLDNKVSITAPSDTNNTRWQRKNLVWKISATNTNEKLPSDAELTMSTTVDNKVRTAKYSLNANGEFIIPFEWMSNKDFTFVLDSKQEAFESHKYKLTAQLCIGSSKDGTTAQPAALEDNIQKASSEINLTVPMNTAPALKISGAQEVLTKDKKLDVNINYEYVNGYYIRAIIQKKKANNEYSGIYTDETITATGDYAFDLSSTDEAGSYRLWITVSTDKTQKQTLLEVPYYFIVQ